MSKVKKSVFSVDEVIHQWANGLSIDAKSPLRHGRRQVFIEGNTIYSYGHHYRLGVMHEVNGHKVALINNHRYSFTTGKHISMARHATSHLISFNTGNIDNIDSAIDLRRLELLDNIEKLKRRTKFRWATSATKEVEDFLAEYHQFNSDLVKIKKSQFKIPVPGKLYSELVDNVQKRMDRQKQLDKLRKDPEYQQKQLLARQRKEENAKQKWLNGGVLTW
jgi:hypothetical protein